MKSKWIKLLAVLVFAAALAPVVAPQHAAAATCTAQANGNWSTYATWSGCGANHYPGQGGATGDIVVIGGTTNNYDVTLDVSGLTIASLTMVGRTASGNMTYDWLRMGSNSLTVNGNVSITGGNNSSLRYVTLDVGTGTLTVSGNLTFVGSTSNTARLTISNGGTMNIAGVMTSATAEAFTAGATSTVNFNGTSAQTINVTDFAYGNVTINNTSASGATLGAAVTSSNIAGNLTVATGTLNNGGYAITLASGRSFAVQGTSTFNLTGTSTMVTVSGGGTKTFASGSTVNYGGANQTVTAEIYGNLTLSGSGTKTMPGSAMTVAGNFTMAGTASATAGAALTVSGNFALGSGTTFSAGSFTHNIGGNFSDNGTFNAGNSTANFNGSAAQALGGTTNPQTFYNFSVNKSGGSTLTALSSLTTLYVDGSVTISNGIFAAGSLTDIYVKGDWINNSKDVVPGYAPFTGFDPGSCTVTFNGSAIALDSFSVEPAKSSISVAWETASETEIAGFNVLRSPAADGEYVQINAELIPAQGGPTQSASYNLLDPDVVKGKTYYYKLEDLDIHGGKTVHGPVSAKARNAK